MQDVLRTLGKERCSAILRHDDQEVAWQAMEAAVRGGFKAVEFTLTTPGAYELIADFARRPGLLVGAGTVLEPEQARRAVAAGARFLVSPIVDPAIVRLSHELNAVAIPGTCTPTEMWQAHQAGALVVKLFPAAEKGPTYVKACLGPLPFLRIFPTNGVTADNAAEFLRAGSFGVGFVGSLFEAQDMRARAYPAIEARARRLVEIVRGA
jgi:2-dehydro-3-deoxyphosphogluconate aldolase/(4S)-4-hydroxy-2-oxoglutarate aldolase